MATKVPKTLIKSIDPSQIDSGGATNGQVLTYNGSTSTWVASSASTSVVLLSSNGYTALGNGLILQWGQYAYSGTSGTIIFPKVFSVAVYSFTALPGAYSAITSYSSLTLSSVDVSSVLSNNTGTTGTMLWMAIGK
jgi:hypothetical protein